MVETYYDILGLPWDANDSQIGQAYRKRKAELQRNPDRLRLVEEAYNTLANPIKRRDYLQALRDRPPQVHNGQNGSLNQTKSVPVTSHAAPPASNSTGHALSEPPARRARRQPTELYEPPPLPEPSAPAAAPEPAAPVAPALPPTEIIEYPSNEHTRSAPPVERAGLQTTDPELPVMDITQTDLLQDDATRIARLDPQAARRMQPQVQVIYQGKTDIYVLEVGVNWIGRPSKSVPPPTVPLPDPERYISRQHARIFVEGDTCMITDTSDNGTQLNGKWLTKGQPHRLKDGDVVSIEGRELTIRLP
jgi:hypothetical protein